MGRDSFSGYSLLIIADKKAADLVNEFSMMDDDISLLENLVDCLGDYDWEHKTTEFGLTYFVLNDEQSDEEFDWDSFEEFARYAEDGSYFEELIGDYIEDDDGVPSEGIFVGEVSNGKLTKTLYALKQDKSGETIRAKMDGYYD